VTLADSRPVHRGKQITEGAGRYWRSPRFEWAFEGSEQPAPPRPAVRQYIRRSKDRQLRVPEAFSPTKQKPARDPGSVPRSISALGVFLSISVQFPPVAFPALKLRREISAVNDGRHRPPLLYAAPSAGPS